MSCQKARLRVNRKGKVTGKEIQNIRPSAGGTYEFHVIVKRIRKLSEHPKTNVLEIC